MTTQDVRTGPTPDPELPQTEAPAPLRAVHTPNFPALLRQLGASLLVTTYQAGKAFVGLSQVRESAVFSGIPITERLTEDERTCGVCVIDLTTGQVVALLRFDTAVQEVFAVALLPGRRYPDLINDDEPLLENSFTVPDAALADVPAALRGAADPSRRKVTGS